MAVNRSSRINAGSVDTVALAGADMKSDRYSRGTFAAAGLAMLAALTAFGCSTLQSPDSLLDGAGLRINQLQVLGSHNSYSLGVDPQLMAMYAPRVGEVIARRLAMVSAAARHQ